MTSTTHPTPPTGLTQCQMLAQCLNAGYAITPLEALHMFGIGRLAARISDLRQDGWPILAEWVTVSKGKRVKRYRLDSPTRGRELNKRQTDLGL